MIAGDSCNRGMLIGALIGAARGMEAVTSRDALRSGLVRQLDLARRIEGLAGLVGAAVVASPLDCAAKPKAGEEAETKKDDREGAAGEAGTSSSNKSSRVERTFTIAGFNTCPFYRRAVQRGGALVAELPHFHVRTKEFSSRDEYQAWLVAEASSLAPGHTTCPLVLSSSVGNVKVEEGGEEGGEEEARKDTLCVIGGCDDFVDLCRTLK